GVVRDPDDALDRVSTLSEGLNEQLRIHRHSAQPHSIEMTIRARFYCRQSALNNLAGLDAAGADANPLGNTVRNGLYPLQVRIPAPPRHVVRVRDIVTKLRPLAAKLTYLCHDNLQKLPKTCVAKSTMLPRVLAGRSKEENGRHDWTRTNDLYRVKVAL